MFVLVEGPGRQSPASQCFGEREFTAWLRGLATVVVLVEQEGALCFVPALLRPLQRKLKPVQLLAPH